MRLTLVGLQTVFVHSRAGPNLSHGAYARSVGATFVPVDFLLPWEDRPSSRLRRYLSWVLCATRFPRRRTYDVFLTDGPQFPLVLMRKLGLIRGRQRLVAIMGDETLYFLRTNQFSPLAARAITRALRTYDAVLCVGEMTSDIARELLGGGRRPPQVFTVHPVWESNARLTSAPASPSLEDGSLVFVGHGPTAQRGWYKGLDLLVQAFAVVLANEPRARLRIAGRWDAAYTTALQPSSPDAKAAVSFVGPVADVMAFLASASLYVHLGRGEAFGISVLEAMAAGVPALVSDWTGAAEAVRQVDDRLVVPLEPSTVADRILWYLALPLEQKRRLADRSREVAADYGDERALAEFGEVFTAAARGTQPVRS